MPKLFSYVVEHDFGRSPNPTGGYCTLAFCKYRTGSRRNVVELAEVGDWVVGTGGLSKRSVGERGRLVYAMRVTEKMTLRGYFRDPQFDGRAGNDLDLAASTDRFALVSDHFFYFGKAAPPFAPRHLNHPIEKRGRGFRSVFPERFVLDFVGWLEGRFAVGVHGEPCARFHESEAPAASLGLPARRPRRVCRRTVICPLSKTRGAGVCQPRRRVCEST